MLLNSLHSRSLNNINNIKKIYVILIINVSKEELTQKLQNGEDYTQFRTIKLEFYLDFFYDNH
ncbi:hypothetical protein BpHYR1_034637 [Brachionus plicatilis]|uniref:Uncharacterized protein n=1 Tax=Brachionus plicatilis TaxID=10195 RepID=A0A3M7R6K6_BRAPC|nr:hypothetical protein BpHYR1_034637 [Brachionus plicatilis]